MFSSTIAFFGATGGCTNACLIHALRSNYKCICLVRNPQKLRDQLKTQGIEETTTNQLITFIEGNAHDIAAVKRTLLASSSGTNTTTLPTQIVTGLGGTPGLKLPSLFHPLDIVAIDQPNICTDAANILVQALTEIYNEHPHLKSSAATKPGLTFVSTTGITRGPEDVPFAIRALYHGVLKTPHMDKKKMEDIYRAPENVGLFAHVTGVRPTLLMGAVDVSDTAGLEKVRAGTEERPETGYSIKRADVGRWMWENVVRDEAVEVQKGGRVWRGEMCSLTS